MTGRLQILRHPYFERTENRQKTYELAEKPEELQDAETIDQRTWERYQRHRDTLPVWRRADNYHRLMDELDITSIRALARRLGEDHSRIARVLKILDLPEKILDWLQAHETPDVIRLFSERKLRELARMDSPRQMRAEFQNLLRKAGIPALPPG